MLRLRGGGKKRKKKTYTKPKKVKHVHKSVKLAVLKFYRVDDNGKVQRLRKSCPNEECGVGVRMAVHKDRFYCGKCGLTVRVIYTERAGNGMRRVFSYLAQSAIGHGWSRTICYYVALVFRSARK